MDQSAILGKICTYKAMGLTSCNFPVAVHFFPKSHSRPCDNLYKYKQKDAVKRAENAQNI